MAVNAGSAAFAEDGTTNNVIAESSAVMLGAEFDINDFLPDEDMIRQDEALQAYGALYDRFEQDEEKNYIYPANYAGEYIDDDFNLVLLITDAEDQFYRDSVKDYDCVKFEKVDYSYSELNELRQNSVNDLLAINDSTPLYCGSYIDVKSNVAVIEVDRCVASLSKFKNEEKFQARDNKAIRYELVDGGAMAQTTTVIGGDHLSTSAASYTIRFTSGMAGFHNGKPAIVSCGHGQENLAKVSLLEGSSVNEVTSITEIGKVSFCRFDNNEYGDYSFIVLNDTIQTTNEVKTNTATKQITSGYNKPLPVGAEVYSYGAYSGLAKSKVTYTQAEKNMNMEINGTKIERTIKGLTITEITKGGKQNGDSGGPYYILENGEWNFCGVHCGTQTNDNSKVFFTPYMYFSGGFQCKTS